MKRESELLLLYVLVVVLCIIFFCSCGRAGQPYSDTTIREAAGGERKKVTLSAWLAYVSPDDGGRRYARVCDDPKFTGKGMDFAHCAVIEIMRGTRFNANVGERITLRGASYFEWWQTHPKTENEGATR